MFFFDNVYWSASARFSRWMSPWRLRALEKSHRVCRNFAEKPTWRTALFEPAEKLSGCKPNAFFGERRPTTSGRQGQNGTSHDIHRINKHQINQDTQTLVMTDFNLSSFIHFPWFLRLQVRIFRERAGGNPEQIHVKCREFQKRWAVATGSLTRGQEAPFRKDGLWLETQPILVQFGISKDSVLIPFLEKKLGAIFTFTMRSFFKPLTRFRSSFV